MRIFALIFLITITIFAKDITKTTPIVAKIINVAVNDVLNIRVKPNFSSKKIGFLKNGEVVAVEKCINVSTKSKWCKINTFGFFEYKDSNFKYNQEGGWVNAKYLKPSYSSYVSVDIDDSQAEGVSCAYALDCNNGMCDVLDDNGISKIKRSKITPFSPYGGHCDYLVIPGEKPQKYNDLKSLVLDIEKWTALGYVSKVKQKIHPKNGLLMTYYTTFARKNIHFTPNSYAKFYRNDKKLYWGMSEGKGDKIYLSLEEFFKKFHNINASYKDNVKKINPSKYYFPNPKDKIAYKVKSLHKDNSWVDMVVVLQKYKGYYYVVGILFDRWSI